MGIVFGSARMGENGSITGGAAGDQTGAEVSTQPYYMHSKGWYCLRPKSASVGAKMASAMAQACANNNIGYDQDQRNGVVTQVKKYGSLGAIGVRCESDCSSLIRACVWQATGRDVGDMYTGNLASVLESSGLFERRFSVSGSGQLYNGDVLVTKTKGHVVVVVSGRARSGSGGGDYMFEMKTVKSGSKGNHVLLVQEILKARGYKGKDGKVLELDKDCGANTAYAIKNYQRDREKVNKGICGGVDGIAGTKTLRDMIAL